MNLYPLVVLDLPVKTFEIPLSRKFNSFYIVFNYKYLYKIKSLFYK